MGSQPSQQVPRSTKSNQDSKENNDDDTDDRKTDAIEESDSSDEETDDVISLNEQQEEKKKNCFDRLKFNIDVIKDVKAHVTESQKCSQAFWKSAQLIASIQSYISKLTDSATKNKKLQQQEGALLAEEKGIEAILNAIIHVYEMNDNFQYLLTEEEDDSDNKAWSAAYLLLIHIVNFTDINQKLSKLVVNHHRFVKFSCGLIQKIGSKYPNDDTFGGGKNKTILDNLMTIMHNVAQTGAHAVALRSAHVVEVFIPYLKTNSDDIKIYALSVLAELMDENEAKSLEANHKSIEYFLGIFNEAVDSDDGRSSDGWSSGELAHVVRQIARNDVNKKTLVNLGCLAPLEKLAMSNDMKEKREAARAIWTLSFDEENQVKMVQGDSGTVDLLLELHRQTDRKVKKASNGALWNMRKKLNESEKYSKIAKEMFNMETKSDGDQITRSKADGHVMISYQWGNQKLLIRIKECLRRNNIKVWMDVDDMQGSTLAAMARAVEEASIVLVCFSQKYKDSDNCRAEAEYAFQQKKTIIPLKMELGYKPDGWLGFIIGTKLFFDFSGKYPFEHKVEGLVKEIQSKLNRIVPTKVNNTMSSEYTVPDEKVPTYEMSPIAAAGVSHAIKADENIVKWTEKDVHDWANQNDLPGETFAKLEGADIAFLKVLRRESPDFFYKTLQDMLKITDLRTLRKFTFALENAK